MNIAKVYFLFYFFNYFLSGVLYLEKSDKAKDEPADPKGDLFLNKMKTINTNYKDDIEEDITHLGNYGHISALSGDFVFNHCKNCGGPMIGHEKEEKDCKEKRIENETIGRLQDKVHGHYMFQVYKAATKDQKKLCVKNAIKHS